MSGGASGGAAAGFGGVTRGTWAAKFLTQLGVPTSVNNLHVIVAWESGEGTAAAANPLATTQPMPGASAFNSVGVRNYVSTAQGLDATVKTIRNGHYGAILASLYRSADPVTTGQLIDASPWGTHGVAAIARSYRTGSGFHAAAILPVPPGTHDTRSISGAADAVVQGAEHVVTGATDWIVHLSLRIAMIVIGGGLLLLGVYVILKDQLPSGGLMKAAMDIAPEAA